MTRFTRRLSLVVLIAGLALTNSSVADVTDAEDVAWKIGAKYQTRGYSLYDTGAHGTFKLGAEGGTYQQFNLRVVKGVDYVFLAAGDFEEQDLDLYVYSDVGQLIIEDRRGPDTQDKTNMAGVNFRADYNGTVQVYLHMYSASSKVGARAGLAFYYVLAGNRKSAFYQGGNKTNQILPE